MNSKSEFNRSKLPRIVIEQDEEEAVDEVHTRQAEVASRMKRQAKCVDSLKWGQVLAQNTLLETNAHRTESKQTKTNNQLKITEFLEMENGVPGVVIQSIRRDSDVGAGRVSGHDVVGRRDPHKADVQTEFTETQWSYIVEYLEEIHTEMEDYVEEVEDLQRLDSASSKVSEQPSMCESRGVKHGVELMGVGDNAVEVQLGGEKVDEHEHVDEQGGGQDVDQADFLSEDQWAGIPEYVAKSQLPQTDCSLCFSNILHVPNVEVSNIGIPGDVI